MALFILTTAALSFLLPRSIEINHNKKSKELPELSAEDEPDESDIFLRSLNIESEGSDVG